MTAWQRASSRDQPEVSDDIVEAFLKKRGWDVLMESVGHNHLERLHHLLIEYDETSYDTSGSEENGGEEEAEDNSGSEAVDEGSEATVSTDEVEN